MKSVNDKHGTSHAFLRIHSRYFDTPRQSTPRDHERVNPRRHRGSCSTAWFLRSIRSSQYVRRFRFPPQSTHLSFVGEALSYPDGCGECSLEKSSQPRHSTTPADIRDYLQRVFSVSGGARLVSGGATTCAWRALESTYSGAASSSTGYWRAFCGGRKILLHRTVGLTPRRPPPLQIIPIRGCQRPCQGPRSIQRSPASRADCAGPT